MLTLLAIAAQAQDISWAHPIVDRVRAASFPELQGADIRLRPLRSLSDYFQTRFVIQRFLLGRRMRYLLFVNPGGSQAPGIESIVAHELEYIVQYRSGSRLRLFGLVRLLSPGYTAKFERRTDLRTLQRGCRDGLADYRS